MKVDILTPSGFCGGVINVLKLINYVVETHKGQPIYCIGQVVHNTDVNNGIEKKGVKVMLEDKEKAIDLINEGVVIFSAHGTDERITKRAKEKGLIVYNAVCPFVDKSFDAIRKYHIEGYSIIYIGKQGHDEANAALSICKDIYLITNLTDVEKLDIQNKKIAVINQTTLSTLDIKDIYKKILEKYPNCKIVDEICSTTRLRQQRLIEKATEYDLILIVGDTTSSNSMSLYNIAKRLNPNSYMVLNENFIKTEWFFNKESVLLVSGASTPNEEISKIIKKIKIN